MNRVRRLFSFQGEISAMEYFWWAFGLFCLKYPLDWFVATTFAGIKWYPHHYFSVFSNPLFDLHKAGLHQWLPMLAVAAPFLWMGLALTIQRLRALNRAPAWSVFFFFPFLNVVFFAALCLMNKPPPEPEGGSQVKGPLDAFVPEDQWACVAVALLVSVLLAGSGFLFSYVLRMPYGANVFFAIPFLCGYLTRMLIGYRHNVGLKTAIWWACASQLVCAGILVSFAVEGMFCVMIALPVVIPVAILGAVVAHYTEPMAFPHLRGKTMGVVGLIPLALLLDSFFSYGNPSSYATVSKIRIQAPPETVWKNVVEFPKLGRPDASQDVFDMFMIPKLQGAYIEGRGVGAIRHCQFHTGEFVEPVEVWKPGQELRFGVTSQPVRLQGSVNVTRGQFLLDRQPDGSTLVTGTTWYQVSMFPNPYWNLWMDHFLHVTHMRALEHVRDLSEQRVY